MDSARLRTTTSQCVEIALVTSDESTGLLTMSLAHHVPTNLRVFVFLLLSISRVSKHKERFPPLRINALTVVVIGALICGRVHWD